MKTSTIIFFVLFIFAVSAGLVWYARRTTLGGAASIGSVPTTVNQQPAPDNTALSPIPTVAQIPLTITSPVNGSSVTSPALIIRGVTLPKADVFVNESEVAADAQGKFAVQVTLDEGENTLVVTTNDANGNYSEQTLTITYNLGQ